MTRAAIYTRYSDDSQNDRSCEDQATLLREFAAKHGMKVVAVFDDPAISGASIKNRPAVQRLLASAFNGDFDVVLVESTSRIGRDQEDRAYIRKRLSFCDVRLMTPSDGVVTQLVDGVRAVVDSQYLEDLKVATRRGMAAVIADGRNSGGRAYGYRAVKGEPGKLEILPDEAEAVRKVFALFLDGLSTRAIAYAMNAAGVTPPRGRYWRASSILGSAKRGHGILRNALYAGRIVWNRVRMVKHPDTGRRLSRINPQSEWRYADAAHLAIIDGDTFARAQQLLAARGGPRPNARRKPRYMLSGLLRCGACGAGMNVRGVDRKGRRIYCARFTDAKSCSNSRGYYLTDIERAVVAGFKERLGSRAAIAHFIRCYNEERQRSAADATRQRTRLERDLAEAQRTLDRMIDAHIRARVTDDEAEERLPALRAERDRIKAELAASDAPPRVVALHPAAIDEHLKSLARLAELINDDLAAGDSTAVDGLRKLIDHVTVVPAPAGKAPTIAVSGHLETLLNLPAFTAGSLSRGTLVAGGGLGPDPATDFPVFSFTRKAVSNA